MNYGLMASLLLIIIMLIGFILYEKSKISSKQIALIAALSGIAGVVRIPFAGIPNVQPTTFLIIITGYVFGARTGFLVGTLTVLISNSFLGHGPWTPWQMLAWGLVGLSSGLLKSILGRPNKWVLSIFAFCWGFLFDYIMNLWHWLFFIYPLNLKSFIAVYAASFYFDLLHAISNFLFTNLFGKDVVTILSRFKNKISYKEIKNQKYIRKEESVE